MRMNSRDNLQRITGLAHGEQINYGPCHMYSCKLLSLLKKLMICVVLIPLA
jgi:hypothetical protein